MTRFAHPWYIFLLLLILPVVFFWGRSTGGRIRFSSLKILKDIGASTVFHPRQILLLLRVFVIVFFVLALARPQSGKKFTKITSEGIDIMLLLDTSGSMKAMDFELSGERVERLDIVKDVVEKFIRKRPNDRMGIIVFGDDAYTQCPLTLDHGIVIEFLKKLEIGMAGQATAIGSAIGVGVNRMKDIKAKSKIMILLTDGKNTAGRISPIKASEISESFNIKIYTIGVGTKGKAPFLVNHPFFGKKFMFQNIEFDEQTLMEIAKNTKARYFAANKTSELEKIYDDIDKLETTKIEAKEYTEYNEIFHYFLLIGVFLLLVEIILGNTILRKIP
ncbi:MAG: VWA domain-containing protein [Bacteriovoracaceae bacterium]|nr:VWA domain-containing protein [Bacteriovoracaceae bacterium]